jgi:hypothetical protein
VVALRAVFGQLGESFVEREPMWRARLELVRANPQLWPRMFAAFAEFERVLTEAVATRTGCDPDVDLYPGVVAAAVVGAMRVAMAHWRAASGETSLSDLLEAAFDILAVGLAEPEPTGAARKSDHSRRSRGDRSPRSHTSKEPT